MNKKILSFILLTALVFNTNCLQILAAEDIQVLKTEQCRYPDYAKMYVGEDKYEKFNRKMFALNSRLNKYVARPVHILWASIMPQYGMDRIKNAYNNIEYPKRLASCLLQKDGQAAKKETLRFLTNSTLGLGGMFDPAKKIFKVMPTNENMDQALAKCKVKQGTYLVAPVLSACTPRSLCGRALEAALDPALYLASPITSIIKFGLMVNRTSYMQPLAKMLETTFADPYDIQKKLFGLENYIRSENLDRSDILTTDAQIVSEDSLIKDEIESNISDAISYYFMWDDFEDNIILGAASSVYENEPEIIKKETLNPDIKLSGFEAQSPVVDSMRTALFDNPDIDKSVWNELSIWNRSFSKRVKTGEVSVTDGRADYKYYYILQKDKNSPLAILYPSIGEGASTRHSFVFAKMLYDLGFSVIMQGSHFHWEFVRSMPEGFCPGIPKNDVEYIKLVTTKIIQDTEKRYNRNFDDKIVIGTSFGAMATLFLADSESKNNTLNINRYIAISPPIELTYALSQLDKNGDEFDKNSDEVKHKTASCAAKILQLLEAKDNPDFEITTLPFSEEEGKLITTFLLRQKLSDLIFTIENVGSKDAPEFYENINNISYTDYVSKYLLNNDTDLDKMNYVTSLYSLKDYLSSNDNYRIYHSVDDFFTNQDQISRLKLFAGNRLVCLSNGSHLGFLYRKEFIDSLKNYIITSFNISEES